MGYEGIIHPMLGYLMDLGEFLKVVGNTGTPPP